MTGLETPRIGEAQARRDALARFQISADYMQDIALLCLDCAYQTDLASTPTLADAVDAADLHWQENHA